MKKRYFTIVACLLFFIGQAQDTTSVKEKERLITQEIGFNVVSLISQLDVFNTATLQAPYQVFYNIYFKDLVGLRVGAGLNNSSIETKIEGQNIPRVTTSNNINIRAGASYNFARYKLVTFNAFADYLYEKMLLETSTTTTLQVFPNPVSKQTVKTLNEIKGTGFQCGVGVKFNIYKRLSLYTEIPIIFMSEVITSEDSIQETGEEDLVTNTTSYVYGTRIALPTTVYLVLRF